MTVCNMHFLFVRKLYKITESAVLTHSEPSFSERALFRKINLVGAVLYQPNVINCTLKSSASLTLKFIGRDSYLILFR